MSLETPAALPEGADPPLARTDAHPRIVGVGASAGGLEALQQLFEATPADVGLAFVVVQHLSPDFKSMMPELLARHTQLAVRLAETGTPVEKNAIYLIPPRKEMIIQGGILLLKDREPQEGPFLPVDTFLQSLAQDQGPSAMAVILSGSGTDGTRGAIAIHEAGGLVLAQSEASAKFTGMPRSAIEAGVVDAALAPDEIPAALARWAEDASAPAAEPEPDGREPMERLLGLLRAHTGLDFSQYKPTTVTRRLERRLRLSHATSVAEYLERIGRDDGEIRALYQDLLIGVTSFFRDPDAYARLELDLLPDLVRGLPPGEELRVWVAACATGEEAYSIAMLAIEAFEREGRPVELRVFGTDVHRQSLDTAGAGVYPLDSLRGVSPARLERFFETQGLQARVLPELRSRVVFAPHDVLRDAPFTRLDLISCRNLLIYLKPAAQRRALSLFHFGLRPRGVLMLGSSETPGELEDEFAPVDARWKIFRKRRDTRLHVPVPFSEPASHSAPVRRSRARDVADQVTLRAQHALARRYGPPSLVVDAELRVVLALNGAGRFLEPRDGLLSANAMDLVAGELRYVLSSAVRQVAKDAATTLHRVRAGRDPGEVVDVSVSLLDATEGAGPQYLVCLEPVGEPRQSAGSEPARDVDSAARQRVEELEVDLRYARENLQATLEEMEASNEELQATNEELVAANEELQSTNEELHSVNEELYTVNAEHQLKIAELVELTSDMDSLLESTQVHMIYLDADLRIRKFTPRMAETFKLLRSDVGRRINDFAHDLNRAELMEDVQRVLETGRKVEAEVRDRRGDDYLLRVLPYRSSGVIDGVVVTLIEIGTLKQAERDLARSERRYRSLVRASAALVFTADPDGGFVPAEDEWTRFTGQPAVEARGRGWLEVVHPEDREYFDAEWRHAIAHQHAFEVRARIHRADGSHCHCVVRAAPVAAANGPAEEWVGYVADCEEEEEQRARLAEATMRLQGIFDHSPVPVFVKDRAGRYVIASRAVAEALGRPLAEIVGSTDFDLMPVEIAEALRRADLDVITTGTTRAYDEAIPTPHGTRQFLSSKFALRDATGAISGVGGVSVDVTEQHQAAQEMQAAVRRRDEFIAMLSHELRNPLSALVSAFYLIEGADEAQRAAAHRVARRQLTQIRRLLDDLLDVTRLTRGDMEVRRAPLHLDEVLSDAVEAVQAEARAQKIEIELSLPDSRVPVMGDPARLQQMCVNLLTNAIRFSSAGTRVAATLRVEDAEAVLEVRDRGAGIPSADLERIFELFYQHEPGIARSRGGLGIGLSLVRRIVERHGGSVTAESEGPGRGSTFTVRLPRDETARAGPRVPARELDDRPLRVVLVEDNADAREMMRALLERRGHSVSEAADGESGLHAIESGRPDVAIVDVGLPGLDGYAVARGARNSLGRSVALIALTGYGRDSDRRAAHDAGFDAHLTKPVDPDALLRVVTALARPPGEGET